MVNTVDPDQTAPSGAVWSGSTLFAYVILSDALVFEFLGHLPYQKSRKSNSWFASSKIVADYMYIVNIMANHTLKYVFLLLLLLLLSSFF